MNYKNHISKIGICNFKVHPLPQNYPSQTTSCEDRNNTQRNEDKHDSQKYLNIYESIEKNQPLTSKQKAVNQILQVKKCTNHKNGIFQNPFLQNSCSQICNQDQNTVTQKKYQIFNGNQNKQSLENSILIPSKKNQMNLKMIIQHKYFTNQNKKPKKIAQGNWITSSKHKDTKFCSSNFGKNLNYKNADLQAQENQNLTQKNAYKSYYQTKFQQQYRTLSSSKLKKTKNFIHQIDRFIQNEKNRQQIIRPRTSNVRNNLLKTDLKLFKNKFVDEDQSINSNAQEKHMRFQSENRFYNQIKSQNKNKKDSPNSKTKSYHFHKKYYQPLKSFSFHPDDEKQNKMNFSLLKIATESPLAKSVFLTSKQEKLNKKLNTEQISHSKKHLQKRCIKNGKTNEVFQERSKINIPFHQSRDQQRTSRMTLNKIQESIANDLQISIRHLDTKF